MATSCSPPLQVKLMEFDYVHFKKAPEGYESSRPTGSKPRATLPQHVQAIKQLRPRLDGHRIGAGVFPVATVSTMLFRFYLVIIVQTLTN